MALLNKEIESEEHALTEEMTILDDLRKNLKIEESLRKQQKTKHDDPIHLGDESKEVLIRLAKGQLRQALLLKQRDLDSDLVQLARQLQSHVESLHFNSKQVSGLSAGLLQTKSSLDEMFLR
ncbi:hypothetical protein MMC12_003833 [Toensbergia leucococca]|nr:hypothetical protein [Toensbergia leucococca]